ncbi:MAG TPA: hypothetical protein VGS19_01325 [Streptosporangiaceae bacterium]|nr:hypothetical protein [Streptosporangiaceae bacterium]
MWRSYSIFCWAAARLIWSPEFAEPAAFGGLADPLVQIGDDLGEPDALLRVAPQNRSAVTSQF